MILEPGQVAVVTGAASGIGRALAHAFARRGLTVVAVDVEEGPLNAIVAELHGLGVPAQGQRVDVRDPEAVTALAEAVVTAYGRVDVVCNNAGVVTPRVLSWEVSAADARWTLEVNLLGVLNGIRAFVPYLVAAGRGHVVNTASVAGLTPVPGGSTIAYTASKYAVVGASETLALELAHLAPAVGVTVLCPGPVPSRILEAGRNRPAEAGASSVGVGALPAVALGMTQVPAEQVAELVCAAIEARRALVVTAADVAELARARVRRLLAELDG